MACLYAVSGADWSVWGTIYAMPRNQRQPTPEELDERVKLDLEPDEAIRLIMETGEAPDKDPANPPGTKG